MIGIIGGSGLYTGIEKFSGKKEIIDTGYGKVEVLKGLDFIFISRHGDPPKPPHMVNYHANIKAFELLGVKKIIAISSVGSLRQNISPGTIFLPDDLLDFTHKVWTYHNEDTYHVNLYEPFCKELRDKISDILKISKGGTYATMKGPQFETRAEEKMLKKLGADVVGMTIAPEAKLAKELNLCYQPLCVVVNYVGEDTSHEGTIKTIKKVEKKLILFLNSIISLY